MKIVIAGAGAVGTHLSKLLSGEHQNCVLIDDNEERLEGVAEYDVMTYCALPTSIGALKEAGADKADLFEEVPIATIQPGDVIEVMAGRRIPVDGTVRWASSFMTAGISSSLALQTP